MAAERRAPPGGRRPLVWIVDDSPTEAMIAERSLGPAYDFERFIDGLVVVERLAAGGPQPDLVLLDWVMPGMAGDEVCRFLRTDPRTLELPIILLTTSRTEASNVAAGLASGANDYVVRPFATEELRARVDAAIRTKRLGDLARQEGRRLATINRLGRALLEARTDIPRILHELAASLTVSLCDGCSILLLGSPAIGAVTRHRADPSGEALAAIASVAEPVVHSFASSEQAREALPAAYAAYIGRFGLRGLAILPLSSRELLRGIVSVTRDGGSGPFDDDDLATIETCIEYASLAVESAMRFDAERSAERAVNTERERIAQFQQEMLGIVGHDLRGPLGSILIGAEMLAVETKNEPANAYVVKRISSCARRMTRMVDQLLDMTRARLGGGIAMARQRTQLLPLIKSAMEDLALAHTGTRFELVAAAAEVVGLWDPDRLGQVVSNLMSNAVQYGLAGAPITIGVACAEGAVTITVHNQLRGEPIPPDVFATLFEPYRRGGDHGNSTGLGLGLYIVHEIVRAHGGTIDAESSQSGTTFRVVLPEARGLVAGSTTSVRSVP